LLALALVPDRAPRAEATAPIQVALEVKLVQVRTEDTRDLGFQWGSDGPSVVPPPSDPKLGGLPVVGRLFEQVEQGRNSRVLAAPRVVATNEEPAEIFFGGDLDFDGVVYPRVGVQLRVTPIVREGGGSVGLEIGVDVDQIEDSRPVPTITSTRAQTTVELRDGQSFAIAGLYQDRTREAASQIPALGDLPILGWLFGRRGFHEGREGLLIFVTPRLVGEAATSGGRGAPRRPGADARRNPQVERPRVDPNLRQQPGYPQQTPGYQRTPVR
jgi:type II secretory pathway component GspD/PulD (secretin)